MDKIELKVIIFPSLNDKEETLAAEIIQCLQKEDRNILIVPAKQDDQRFLEYLQKEIEGVNGWRSMGGDPYFDLEKQTALNHLNRTKEKYLSLNKEEDHG